MDRVEVAAPDAARPGARNSDSGAVPGIVGAEWAVVVLGVLAFISPWVLGFHTTTGAAWTAWIVGIIWFLAGGLTLFSTNMTPRRSMTPQHSRT